MKTEIRLYISFLMNDLFGLPSDNLKEKFVSLRRVLIKQENKVLNGLKKITDLTFSRNYIDVFLVDRESVKRSISHPLILRVSDDMEKNFYILVHELIHNLMWDNSQNKNWSLKIQKLFPNENRKTAIHIAVHAIFEALYKDILRNPEIVEKDIKESQKYPDYKKAWEIVKKEGYQNIIDRLIN